jgi:NAD(P)-dependent dehydrogenase (short-subunit alcohol dehydrogenase family)
VRLRARPGQPGRARGRIEPAIETDVVDLLDREATKAGPTDLAARHDGASTGSSISSGAGAGGTPIEEAPSRTGTCSALSSSARCSTRRRPSRRTCWRAAGRFVIVGAGQAQSPTHRTPRTLGQGGGGDVDARARRPLQGTGATANIVVIGAIVTEEMRAESPDKDFSTFTPSEEIAEAIAYLVSDDAASMNGQRVTLRGAY